MTAQRGRLRAQVFWQDAQGRAELREVCLDEGASLADAVRASGLQALLGDADWERPGAALRLAVFGQPRAAQHPLRDGDRVDITRALLLAPGEARRLRARAARGRRRGGGAPRQGDE